MGGLIHAADTADIFINGQEQGQLLMGGQVLWNKPIRSIYPAKTASNTDDILCVGSSDIGCLLAATWSPNTHNWFNTFRDNYAGSMSRSFEGVTLNGAAGAVTYGRVDLSAIISNARNGAYGSANPLANAQNYDVMVLDTSDIVLYNNIYGIDEYIDRSSAPYPYDFYNAVSLSQRNINIELRSRLILIRNAIARGINKFFVSIPWPILDRDYITQEDWLNDRFQNLEDSYVWQHERLNQQLELEGYSQHVNLIPFNRVIKKIAEDIRDGLAPAELTDINNIYANDDNLSATDPRTPDIPKHRYMLNYVGGYAINALFSAIVLDIDPRGKPRTDGTHTLSVELSDYLQELAWDIKESFARSGHTRANPLYTGLRVSRPGEYADVLGSEEIMFSGSDLAEGTVHPLSRAGTVKEAYALVRMPLTPKTVNIFNGAPTTGNVTTELRLDVSANAIQTSFGFFDVGFGDYATINHTGLSDLSGETITVLVSMSFPYANKVTLYNYDIIGSTLIGEVTWEWDSPIEKIQSGVNGAYSNFSPVINNINIGASLQGVEVLELVLCDEPLSNQKIYNLYRYMCEKHQIRYGFDMLWPDVNQDPNDTLDPNDEGNGPIDPDPVYTYGTDPDTFSRNLTPLGVNDRIMHSGHSLMDFYLNGSGWPNTIAILTEDLGATDGMASHIQRTIPGSPIELRWRDHDRDILDFSQLDGIIITEVSPLYRITDRADDFGIVATMKNVLTYAANLIESGRNQTNPYIGLWATWPTSTLGDIGGTGDWWGWGGFTFAQALDEYQLIYKYVADYVTWKLKQMYPSLDPDWRIWVIPGSLWVKRLLEDQQNNLIPGVTSWDDWTSGNHGVFGDDIHPSEWAGYGAALLILTALYHQDFRLNAGTDLYLQGEIHNAYTGVTSPPVTRAQASYFANIAWDIISNYGPAGMGGTQGNILLWDPSRETDPLPLFEPHINDIAQLL